jgi:hypothetical protein
MSINMECYNSAGEIYNIKSFYWFKAFKMSEVPH